MILHPGILIQETIDKFGYDPRNLSVKSKKLVILRCPKCKETRTGAFHSCVKKLCQCRQCSPRTLSENKVYIPSAVNITNNLYAYLLYSCSVQHSHDQSPPYLAGGSLNRPSRRQRTESGFSINQTSTILKHLGISAEGLTTDVFKKAVQSKLLALPLAGLARVVDYILEVHVTLSCAKNKPDSPYTYYTISDQDYKLSPLLDVLGVQYSRRLDRLAGGVVNITYGSFYINGEWIHIG